MTLHLERVPFDSARLPAWLERHLVGDHLGELIEELLAVRPSPGVFDFDRWFASFKDQILSAGLSRVPRTALRQLLAHPPALRQLQTAVLLGGGRYWDEVPRSKGFHQRLKATRPAAPVVVAKARTPAPPRPAPRPSRKEPELVQLVVAPPPEPPARRGLPVWVIVAAVATTVAVSAVAVVVFLLLTNRGE
jgi:hypothetical protein